MITMTINNNEWEDIMYHRKCICGHELYIHAFTMYKFDENSITINVSQCTSCDYDREKEEYTCKEFRLK